MNLTFVTVNDVSCARLLILARAPLVPILATEPMELIAIDFLSIEKGKKGYENVLVVTDSFMKYSWAFPTRNHERPQLFPKCCEKR